MDYSLLITFGKEEPVHKYIKIGQVYITLGIIDYLQEFNSLKKMESRLKGWFKTDISSIESQQYGDRLINFLYKHFEIQKDQNN